MSRRRMYEEDDDEDEIRYRKRSRMVSEPQEIEDKLETLITRVGEKSNASLESNLEQLAGVLILDLSSFKTNVLRILIDCVQKSPEKTTIYSTLIGLLNAKNYAFGNEFVELLSKALKDSLRNQEWETARYCVRFFSDLINCKVISVSSLGSLFDSFVAVINEDSIPQVRSDWFVYTVLSCLPYAGHELHERNPEHLDRILRLIDAYIGRRRKTHASALQVWSSDTPHQQEEYLDCLWSQICKLRSDKWIENHLSRPYLAFNSVLADGPSHTFSAITIPPHSPDTTYPMPRVIFRLFDYTDCTEGPTLPGAHSIERFLIEEHLHRLITLHNRERKQCAALLLSFPGKNKVPFEYMITEVIFAQMFELPKSPQIEICYGSLLLELCKLQPSTMPLVLAQTVELLYERLDTMSPQCADRFCSWFSYHLSNFQFRWTWEEWLDAASYDHLHPKPMFLQSALARCMRLSYHQRLMDLIPPDLQQFVPNEPLPRIKYGDNSPDDMPGLAVSKKLTEAIKSRCSDEEVLELLKELDKSSDEDAMETGVNFDLLKIDVFVHTLMAIACKTMSHSFAGIAKFHYVFKTLAAGSDEKQMQILQSLFEIWRDHHQMLKGIVDKFLKTQIVEASTVVNWVFSEELKSEFVKSYVWEIVHLTIHVKIKQVRKLQNELDLAKSRRDDDEEEPVAPEDLERMEEKLDTAQSELKNLFLIILQRFIMLLTECISTSEQERSDFRTHWFRQAVGRLQEVLFRHHEHVYKYISTLQSLLFSADVDTHILAVYDQFLALRN